MHNVSIRHKLSLIVMITTCAALLVAALAEVTQIGSHGSGMVWVVLLMLLAASGVGFLLSTPLQAAIEQSELMRAHQRLMEVELELLCTETSFSKGFPESPADPPPARTLVMRPLQLADFRHGALVEQHESYRSAAGR